MATIAEELNSFYNFAELRLQRSSGDETLDEIYAEWRASNSPSCLRETDVRAVQASLRDMDSGERGRSFDDFAVEFRQRIGIESARYRCN
jgi:hypothetical protein